jgi:hypothetical protein
MRYKTETNFVFLLFPNHGKCFNYFSVIDIEKYIQLPNWPFFVSNGHLMWELYRYGTNDDNAGFINQMKNRNTSRNTEYDLKLIKNYFASIEEIRNVDGIPPVDLWSQHCHHSFHNEHFPCFHRYPFWQQQTTEVNEDTLITKTDQTGNRYI